MNIFFLDSCPQKAAQYHCDKHVVKMTLETAQLLCTAHRVLDDGLNHHRDLYKLTHVDHPCSLWVRSSIHHYTWTHDLFYHLAVEYRKRYERTHLSWNKLGSFLEDVPVNIEDNGWTNPPQCMPEHYRKKDTVHAYRLYYKGDKASFAKWKLQEPIWW